MHNTTLALTALACFTSPDKAAEIEGDLLEQAHSRGRLWFWWQVKLTCVALFVHNLRQEPGKLLLFAYATYELTLKLLWWVLVPLAARLRSFYVKDITHVSAYDSLVMLLALLLGMGVMRLSPRHGAPVLLLAAGMVIARMIVLDGANMDGLRFVGLNLILAIIGALAMKWLQLRRAAGAFHASHW